MTEPATQSLQTSCFCQSVRGNPDSNVAHIPCLAASEQGGEPGHRGGVRDPGAGANVPQPNRVCIFSGFGVGGGVLGILVRLNSKRSFPLSIYIQIITWLICLLLAKLVFLLRSASWVIKTAQPMVNSTQQVFIKPHSGGTKKVKTQSYLGTLGWG